MSSYFDEASLVMIPSGYKDQKVYSVKPLDGTGDLTFSRASSATRVASNGLIEKVRTNIFTYSNTFSNAAWTKNNTTLTSGQADPFGGNNAWKFQSILAVQSDLRQTVAGAAGYSVYAKAGSYGFISLWTGTIGISFDLTNGTAGAGGKITSVGGGWYRCSVATSSTGSVTLIPYFSATAGDFVYIAFAQAEPTDVPTDYIATTSAAVSVGPVSGLPRLDYQGSTCPKLLLEPQRTNLALYSEQFDNAAWTKTASTTITANSTISPDGTQDADTYTTTASGTGSQIYRVISVSGTTQTLSIFIKYLSGSGTNLRFSIGSVESLGVNLTFSNSGGTLTGVKGSSVNTLNIENYGNNWFRVSISVAYASATAEFNLFRPTGTGTDAYAIWGAQLEASTAYATSYIPTLGTSVTRVVDYAAKGGIGSLLPSQTGTIYVEFDWQRTPDDVQVMSIHNNSTGLAWIAKQSSTQIQGTYFASGYIGTINGSISASSGIVKVAYAWTNGSQAFYVNGVQIGTANASISDSNDLSILELNGFWGITKGGTSVAQTLVFNSRLSNSDLAALTA